MMKTENITIKQNPSGPYLDFLIVPCHYKGPKLCQNHQKPLRSPAAITCPVTGTVVLENSGSGSVTQTQKTLHNFTYYGSIF